MIPRILAARLLERIQQYPIVTLLGPRQAGKTTLVRATFPDYTYVNLENPETRQFAVRDPKGFLKTYPCPLIIDEVQRVPELLSWIQVQVDSMQGNGHFILTGSNQPALGATVTQSLAGRTSLLYLLPLSLEELSTYGIQGDRDVWLVRGFLPRIYQQPVDAPQIYADYLATYVERDMRQLINLKDFSRFEVFLRLLAGRVGQILNLSTLAGDTGVSATTLSHWLSVLEASFIVFKVQPYFRNIGKRLVKSSKIYFYEPGLVASLLQIESPEQAARDPLLSGLFENMVVVELVKALMNRGLQHTVSFYRDSNGHEVDCVLERQRIPSCIEIKASQTFSTDFLRNLYYFKNLIPDTQDLWVIYGGTESFTGSDYRVVGFADTYKAVPGP